MIDLLKAKPGSALDTLNRMREKRDDLASVLADMAYAISPGDGKDFHAIGWDASYEQHFRPVMMRAQKLLKRRYAG